MNNQAFLTMHYENYEEDGRLHTRHGAVEFITTMTYIEKYLCSGMRILEIGAGTGRYSHALAQRGYRVDAVELVEHNIEIFRKNILPDEPVTVIQGNALDLSVFSDNTYDITLLLGPMYHLYTKEEQIQALSEAIRVTKKNGVIFSAYCMSDPSILQYGFMRGNVQKLIADNLLDPETFEASSRPQDIFELYRTEDIRALREHFDVEPLHLLAADGYANHMREELTAMDEETYQLYIRYHLATCERTDLLGYSHHTLDIFRKR